MIINNAGVTGDVSDEKMLAKCFVGKHKRRHTRMKNKGVTVVEYPLRNGTFHAMIHIQQFPGPCDSFSSFLGIDASASEVKMSTISVKASIDSEDEGEKLKGVANAQMGG